MERFIIMFIFIIQIIIAYIISVIFHEIGHSEIANYLGDDTAKKQGRSSLNPFKHFSLTGPKSVPIKLITDMEYIIVNSAGIAFSALLAIAALLFCSVKYYSFLEILFWMNIALVIINCLPIKSTDGYKIMKHIQNIIK